MLRHFISPILMQLKLMQYIASLNENHLYRSEVVVIEKGKEM
jgi:hypothetical protein